MKTCSFCQVSKPLEEFTFRSIPKNVRQGRCKTCRKEYDAKRIPEMVERYRDQRRAVKQTAKDRNRAYLATYLLQHPCVDCGERDIRILQFDHLRDKDSSLSYMLRDGLALQRIIDEIEKCEVRCANCHTIVTLSRAGSLDWRSLVWYDVCNGDLEFDE